MGLCGKCQKRLSVTTLATPAVKKKNEMYYGSSAGTKSASKPSTTLGNNGIGKVGDHTLWIGCFLRRDTH